MPISFPPRRFLRPPLPPWGSRRRRLSLRAAPATAPDARRGSTKKYDMLKSINLWAFPYPERMTLRECLQLAKDAGFDGIELNYDLDNDLAETRHGGLRQNPQDGR